LKLALLIEIDLVDGAAGGIDLDFHKKAHPLWELKMSEELLPVANHARH
jgi:hypothetical protein